MNHRDLHFLQELDNEFERVSGERSTKRSTLRVGRRRATALAATAALLLASSGAVASVTGLIDIGGDESAGLGGLADRAGIATGTTSSGSEWLLTTATNGSRACVALRVEAQARLIGTSEYCGGDESSAVRGSVTEHRGMPPILFGSVSDAVSEIRVSSTEGSAAAQIIDASDPSGRFFVVEVPGGALEAATVQPIDGKGAPLGDDVPVRQMLQESAGSAAGPSSSP